MEIKTILDTLGIPVSTTIVVLLLSFIKIPKVELNLWGFIGKAISSGLNSQVLAEIKRVEEKVDAVESTLSNHIDASEEERALSTRRRILRFSDEIVMGQEHTKEHYEDVLFSIDSYQKYCEDHPDFPNSKCLMACENIKDEYKEKLKNNSFVTVERLVTNKKTQIKNKGE